MQKSILILMNNLVGKGFERPFAYAEAKDFLSNHSFSLIKIFVKKSNRFERRVVATEGTYFASPKRLKNGGVNWLFEDAAKIIAKKCNQEIKSVVISSKDYKIVF